MNRSAPPRPEFCPWTNFAPSTIDFCEENLCAWIVNPANAWSCAAFLVTGAYIWHRAMLSKASHLKLIAQASIMVGLLSFALHATFTYWGEVLDLSSMYLIGGLMVTFNLQRLHPAKFAYRELRKIYWGAFAACLTLTILYRGVGIPIFALQIITACITEWQIHHRTRDRSHQYRWLVMTLATFAVSFGFWVSDVTRLWCDPGNHWINGHVVWHYCNALALVFYARYMETALRHSGPGNHLAV